MRLPKFLLTALFFIAVSSAQAQTKTTTTVTYPDWGVAGQDATYYYIPATETYYDIRSKQYIYQEDGKWVRNNSMPAAYADYDLYNGYKVVLNQETEPFTDFESMKIKYAKDYKGEPQKTYKVKKTRTGKVKIKEK
jgi:hypothetical protein